MRHQKIGLIGGLSPESTVSYYLHITRSYVSRYGNDGYPEILIYSVNLDDYHRWRDLGRWDWIADSLAEIANKLLAAGADFGLVATNTMHKVFEQVQAGTVLPLLHILDPTIEAIQSSEIHTVGLLGTRFTMTEDFYAKRLNEHGISTLVPSADDQLTVHDIIMRELVRGKITPESRETYLEIIQRLEIAGAEGVVLGCTEIPLLIAQQDCGLLLFDTAILHAEAALKKATLHI